MQTIESATNRIAQLEQTYTPGNGVVKYVSSRYILAFVGPLAVGKTTIMRKVADHKDFGFVRSFTTRPRREYEGEHDYQYFEHDLDTLEMLIRQLEDRKLVQVAVDPTSRYIYGSNLEAYKETYNVMAVWSSTMHLFEALPFADVAPIYTVCSPTDWMKRLAEWQETHAHKQDLYKNRIREAALSLEWGLANADRIHWLDNSDGELSAHADSVVKIAHNKVIRDYSNEITIAKAMADQVAQLEAQL